MIPDSPVGPTPVQFERFSRKIETPREPNGCWDWTASINRYGYGEFTLNGRVLKAHRVAYEAFAGPIPPGLQLDHLCRNRKCVRPDHLEAVTHAENVRRGKTGRYNYNSDMTRCLNGHECTAENTHVRPCGRRRCRICARDEARQRRAMERIAT